MAQFARHAIKTLGLSFFPRENMSDSTVVTLPVFYIPGLHIVTGPLIKRLRQQGFIVANGQV